MKNFNSDSNQRIFFCVQNTLIKNVYYLPLVWVAGYSHILTSFKIITPFICSWWYHSSIQPHLCPHPNNLNKITNRRSQAQTLDELKSTTADRRQFTQHYVCLVCEPSPIWHTDAPIVIYIVKSVNIFWSLPVSFYWSNHFFSSIFFKMNTIGYINFLENYYKVKFW